MFDLISDPPKPATPSIRHAWLLKPVPLTGAFAHSENVVPPASKTSSSLDRSLEPDGRALYR